VKIKYSSIFLSTYLFGPPERPSQVQKKPPILQREHPALQNMKFRNFFFFLDFDFLSSIRGSEQGSADILRLFTTLDMLCQCSVSSGKKNPRPNHAEAIEMNIYM
jgi:hypothetical protein